MSWKDSALKHAKGESPKEACGLVCLHKGVEIYWPCRNGDELPTEGFVLHPDDWMEAEDTVEEIVGVFHSHPIGSAQASEVDISSSKSVELPFYICNPDTEEWSEFDPFLTKIEKTLESC